MGYPKRSLCIKEHGKSKLFLSRIGYPILPKRKSHLLLAPSLISPGTLNELSNVGIDVVHLEDNA